VIVNESMLPRWTREILDEIGAASPGLNAESSGAPAEIVLQAEASNRKQFKNRGWNMTQVVTKKNRVVSEVLQLGNKKKQKARKEYLRACRILSKPTKPNFRILNVRLRRFSQG
jgi:hypothetical protein